MSIQEDWHDDEQKPRGMSTTTKVLLTLAAVGGLCFLLWCGGLFVAGWQFQKFAQNAVKKDPQSVRETTDEILHIDLPPEFEPKQAMDLIVWKMAMYQHKTNPNAMVMIAKFGANFPGNQEEQLKAMRQQSQQHGARFAPGTGTFETHEIEIDGEKVPFQFVKTTAGADGKSHWQVSGAIPTKDGMIMVMAVAPDDVLDEEQIDAMLKSIHLPEPGDAAEKPAAEKPATETPSVEQPPAENPPAEKQAEEKPSTEKPAE